MEEIILKGEYKVDVALVEYSSQTFELRQLSDTVALDMRQIEQLYNELGQILLRNNK